MEFTAKGLICPVFTPFHKDGNLNLDIIPQYADFLLRDKTLTGLLINGTSGEGMSMNTSERKLVTEAWINYLKARHPNTHIMIQVGGASLPDVLELAKHAESMKADSLLCLPDLYMKPKNPDELLNYLTVVSKAAPKTHLLYYHIPMFTNVEINMGEFLKHVRKNAAQIPTFAGIKFTSELVSEGQRALESKYAVFLGADTKMLTSVDHGFDSAIATTLNFYTIGIFDGRKSLNDRVKEQAALTARVCEITRSGLGWVSTMKAAMPNLSGIDCGPVRAPMKNLAEKDVKEMWLSLDRSLGGFLKKKIE